MNTSGGKALSIRNLTFVSMMAALTIIMMFTPLGTIPLPAVSISIAHVPAIITAVVLGPASGFFVALSFALTSMFRAFTSPVGLLDPFFQNPLVSVLPRVLIPVTAYYVYKGLHKLLKFKTGEYVAITVGVILGNLTNTFGVYTMMYFIYAGQILEKTGKPAISVILGLISTTTALKTIGVVIVSVPIIYALKRFIKSAKQ